VESNGRSLPSRVSTMTGAERARIAMACGGTAGHVFPACAVADAQPDRVEAVFLGGVRGLESRIMRARGHRLLTTPAAPLALTGVRGKIVGVGSTAAGALAARRILRREAVRLVVGFGGYASAPAVLAAWSLRIPIVLLEGNAVAGTGNRSLAPFATLALLAEPTATAAFRCPTRITGVPVRADILAAKAAPPEGPLHVLVCGGSLGSAFLDDRVPSMLARVAARGQAVMVRHIGEPARAAASYARAKIPATVLPFVDDMAAEYAGANVAIMSAGATTLAELAAVGLPAVLVSLASVARDHQTANARAFSAATGAVWRREADWDDESLAAHVAALAAQPAAWAAAAAGMRRKARADAAAAVVQACLELLGPASSWATF